MIVTQGRVDSKTTRHIVLLSAGSWPMQLRACEVSVVTDLRAERTSDRAAKAVITVTLLALVLVAAVPVATVVAIVMMLLGHVVGGLAVLGGSVLVAALAVAIAGMSGMRHLRKLLARTSSRIVPLDGSQYADVAEPGESDYADVVRLDRSDYTEVR
jgi:hypothetical protein